MEEKNLLDCGFARNVNVWEMKLLWYVSKRFLRSQIQYLYISFF